MEWPYPSNCRQNAFWPHFRRLDPPVIFHPVAARQSFLYSFVPTHPPFVVMSDPEESNARVRQHRASPEKEFDSWSAIALGAITTNSAIGIVLTFASTITYGGSMLLFYGFPIMSIIALGAATSLGELTSAYPEAGGQYIWVARLAPPKLSRFFSYIVAIYSWAGAVCTGASVCLVGAELILDLVEFFNPHFHVKPWMVFLFYQAINILTLIPSFYGKLLNKVTKSQMAFTALLLVGLLVALFAAAKNRRSAHEFFTVFHHSSGWPDGMAVLIGVNSLQWCYCCLDSMVHIADEIPKPERNIPRALMWSIAVGFVTGMICLCAYMFATDDYDTGYSSLTITFQAFGQNQGAAIVIQVLVFVSSIGALWGIHVWQSRLAWTIGYNRGFPFGEYLERIAGPPYGTPVYALVFSSFATALLGFLYLGSSTAFNSLVSASLLFQWISYSIPVIFLNLRGRTTIPHGPFWFPKLGYIANTLLVVWTGVSLVIYCFPYTLPFEAGNMNYVSAVVCGITLLSILCWICYGRKHFHIPELDICLGTIEGVSPSGETHHVNRLKVEVVRK
ncbi:unnamed protein product [Penicillium egyptiacum]|uniref:Choline transport protein n=1 Tax=Penicillium egyptiacum TaxID=1303716 RepID=A0A9W4K5G6_9EURO|nr:unnamed protein product [Penicillium egyptiacum]